MPKRTRKEFQDINQFAASALKRTIEASEGTAEPDRATIAQVMAAMGRRGVLKGAATLNARLTPAQRKRSAQRAAKARWANPADKAAK